MNKRGLLIIGMTFFTAQVNMCMDRFAAILYREQVELINTKHEKKLVRDIAAACQRDPFNHIRLIESKLSFYKDKLMGEKEAAFKAIQDRFKIPQERWQDYRETIKKVKEFTQEHKHCAWPHVVHDSTIPPYMLLMIKKELRKNGVNSEGVCLSKIKDKSFLFSAANSSVNFSVIDNKVILHPEKVTSAHIEFNIEVIQAYPLMLQRAVCIRAIESTMDSSVMDVAVIKTMAPYLTNKPEKLVKSKEVIALGNLYLEKLTTLLPALKSKKNAQLMKIHADVSYTPHFTVDDYNFLSKIARHWKVHAWITKHLFTKEWIGKHAFKGELLLKPLENKGNEDVEKKDS